jgi:antitoxin component YwqK of YwqJK toxin-antitoxin module
MEMHTETYNNGVKKCEGRFVIDTTTGNKNKDGVWKFWYPNGNLESEVFYINNLEEGVAKFWYMDGDLRAEDCYVNGLMHGYSRQWDKKGNLYIEDHYRNGKLDGLSREWSSSGQICSEAEFRNGVLEGLTREWWLNGQLLREVCYSGGYLKGDVKEWFETGQMKSVGEFLHNQSVGDLPIKVGRHKTWYPNGNLESEVFYEDDKPIEGTIWDEEGNIKEVISTPAKPLIVEQETKYECLIYHCEIPSGNTYMVCSFSKEHVHSYIPFQNFLRASHQKEAKCQYCSNPMKETIYKQP